MKNVSTKWVDHLKQNAQMQMIQTYGDTFWQDDESKITTPIDISNNVGIPVGMFVP